MIFSPNVLYSPLKENVLSFLGKRPLISPNLAPNLYISGVKMNIFSVKLNWMCQFFFVSQFQHHFLLQLIFTTLVMTYYTSKYSRFRRLFDENLKILPFIAEK